MTRRFLLFWCVAALLAGGGTARAAIIQILPATQIVSPGANVTLDVVVSNLGGSVVGDFDIDVGFDPLLLTFDSYTLGAGLGSVATAEALNFSLGLVAPGTVNLAEVSTLAGAALSLLQSDPLVLASMVFQVGAMAPGTSTEVQVALVNALGDAAGLAIAVGQTTGATLSGQVGGPAVPEPGTFALLAGAAITAFVRRRIRRRPVSCT